jgi:hypothetical protein
MKAYFAPVVSTASRTVVGLVRSAYTLSKLPSFSFAASRLGMVFSRFHTGKLVVTEIKEKIR